MKNICRKFRGNIFGGQNFNIHIDCKIQQDRGQSPITTPRPDLQNHLTEKKFWSKNFPWVEPGSDHKGKKISNFWKHVFFANWTI